jgi:7-keto-8-aminopelargonate synthetase-like enzyme
VFAIIFSTRRARLRCLISAAHTGEHLERAVNAIVEVAQKFEVVA